MLVWHRNNSDTGAIRFLIKNIQEHYSFIVERCLLTDLTPAEGWLNVTFHESGEYSVGATINQSSVLAATTQIFDVQPPPSENCDTGCSLSLSFDGPSSTFFGSSPSDSVETSRPNATDRKISTSIIIGTIIGSLAFLLLVFGGGTFLFMRQRRQRNMRHRLSPNLKIIPEPSSHSPPIGNKNSQTVSAMLAGEMTPNLGDRSPDTVGWNAEGNPTEDEGERRNSSDTPDASELPQQDNLDVVAEVLRLRTQFQQFIVEPEAEGVQGNALDPPPAYM
ncbi:hypothetical protein EDD85DRAFT_797233 [Armillaria nabsnona]|nr:hypothetical protein EDD85DRAFT_797233 [Armillaria nabsnona]